MLAVTVSPKFQVVIPLAVRKQMQIEAGQKLQVIAFNNRIELLAIESPAQLRGFLAGIDTEVHREGDRA
ncbi:MAG: AbrB/MazE/SpoVT family DNA-binding domain-containing protein [Sulfuritalea sp.]|nr:AbrB/MazE/SpoVT family DNA-binding domain-containing protein [Sulfuritalea sp.]MBK8118941.1 AbrB/MazE/SpoVT family DNA-binding domain-containing protein [Sulfuritalea sp.]